MQHRKKKYSLFLKATCQLEYGVPVCAAHKMALELHCEANSQVFMRQEYKK